MSYCGCDSAECPWEPLARVLARSGTLSLPDDYMLMEPALAFADGASFTLYAFKHRGTRNYLHVDAMGLGTWTAPHPAKGTVSPVPIVTAVEHAISMGHRWDDGCYRRDWTAA